MRVRDTNETSLARHDVSSSTQIDACKGMLSIVVFLEAATFNRGGRMRRPFEVDLQKDQSIQASRSSQELTIDGFVVEEAHSHYLRAFLEEIWACLQLFTSLKQRPTDYGIEHFI